jgi:hypothetical protein
MEKNKNTLKNKIIINIPGGHDPQYVIIAAIISGIFLIVATLIGKPKPGPEGRPGETSFKTCLTLKTKAKDLSLRVGERFKYVNEDDVKKRIHLKYYEQKLNDYSKYECEEIEKNLSQIEEDIKNATNELNLQQ